MLNTMPNIVTFIPNTGPNKETAKKIIPASTNPVFPSHLSSLTLGNINSTRMIGMLMLITAW